MVLARRSQSDPLTTRQEPLVPYVGVAPEKKRGHLRVDFFEKYGVQDQQGRKIAPSDVEKYQWARKGGEFSKSGRFIATWGFLLKLLGKNWLNGREWTYIRGKTEEKLVNRRRMMARWAREEILRLGPTFIKVGQLFSTRADLFPAEVIEELSVLQDNVPAFGYDLVKEIIETELKERIEDIFSYFEQVPIAAASLGQVHYAILATGEQVAVKVQRPRLAELFDLDLNALRSVAQYLQESKTYGGNGRDWVGIYKECANVLYDEIDYELEGKNASIFTENFKDVPWVRIPKVYFDYTTKTVLTMQYIPGIKISDRDRLINAGIDVKLVTDRAAKAFLMQILDHSLFQADPHPGNLSVGPGSTLIYYDFGMVGRLGARVKEGLIDVLLGVVEKDGDAVMNALIDLGALVAPPDPVPVRRAIQYFLDNLQARPTREQTVSTIGDDLYAVAVDKPFRFPALFTFVLRAFTTLEGVNKALNPKFKFSAVSQPYADELLRTRRGRNGTLASLATAVLSGKTDEFTSRVREGLLATGAGALRAPSRIKKIEKAITKLERGDIKLRSRSTETERLLRRQYKLSQNSNYLVSGAATAVVATQLYIAGLEAPAAGVGALSAVFCLLFFQASRKMQKYSLENPQDE